MKIVSERRCAGSGTVVRRRRAIRLLRPAFARRPPGCFSERKAASPSRKRPTATAAPDSAPAARRGPGLAPSGFSAAPPGGRRGRHPIPQIVGKRA